MGERQLDLIQGTGGFDGHKVGRWKVARLVEEVAELL
jgi:hypothetical protein